jgi:hypothetical protein
VNNNSKVVLSFVASGKREEREKTVVGPTPATRASEFFSIGRTHCSASFACRKSTSPVSRRNHPYSLPPFPLLPLPLTLVSLLRCRLKHEAPLHEGKSLLRCKPPRPRPRNPLANPSSPLRLPTLLPP